MRHISKISCKKHNNHFASITNSILATIDNQAVGLQYARALIETARSKGAVEAVHSDINILSAVMKDNISLKEIMVNPLVASDKKIKLITQISNEGSFNNYTTKFLSLLVDKGRIDSIVEVFESFESLYCKETNTQVAIVKSAVALEEEQQFLIAKKIKELTRSNSVKIKPVIDENLIGGFLIEYDSTMIDLSIRGALERVRKELKSVRMPE
jgi:F-type H+-transporting ATPase subunit delta